MFGVIGLSPEHGSEQGVCNLLGGLGAVADELQRKKAGPAFDSHNPRRHEARYGAVLATDRQAGAAALEVLADRAQCFNDQRLISAALDAS